VFREQLHPELRLSFDDCNDFDMCEKQLASCNDSKDHYCRVFFTK
jgi:hypothetical protein